MEKTYYEVLGLKEHVSIEEIKRAYTQWLFVYHLYKNSGDNKFERIFEQENQIYQTLSNPASRKEYDAELGERQKVKSKSNAYYCRMAILIFFFLKLMFNLLTPPVQLTNAGSNYTFKTGIPVH